ncbi:pantoate--beta-alanine ligase [Carnimonas nigrificans]|uniref:pantoate--beta-alanine ligase n=1 Tax=Carnimonas nigrificans TaxID=64323 RepID=UPI0004713663|nr:pantoate--beta-alanine ligase [Carnimonas nigrificans]
MQLITTISDIREQVAKARQQHQRIALVPTMGNLHEGHLTLVREARRHADVVVASIFVNPTQFGPNEDYDRYPRTLESDRQQLADSGCDLLFAPSAQEIYPNGLENLTRVHVPAVSEGLCAGSRPSHFDGVASVVSILFHSVWPDVALFGKKDYQQLGVIRKMVRDLHMPIEIVGVDTVRDNSGLALSSRNGYLSSEEHQQAALIRQRLSDIALNIRDSGDIERALTEGRQQLERDGFTLDYLECRDIHLTPVTSETQAVVVLVAVWLGTTRLIDNIEVTLNTAVA